MVNSSEEMGEEGNCSPPEGAKQYGVTKPISMSGPSESDLQRTLELETVLEGAGLYESEDQSALRKEALGQIQQIVNLWVKQVTRDKGYSEQMVEESNAKVFTFGSYRLGLNTCSSSNLMVAFWMVVLACSGDASGCMKPGISHTGQRRLSRMPLF